MTYPASILKKRITVLNRTTAKVGDYGKNSAGTTYTPAATLWAAIHWTKGQKAMREGALDAYDVVMIRLRYHPTVNRQSIIAHARKYYEIESFHADEQDNTIQITAHEMAAQPKIKTT